MPKIMVRPGLYRTDDKHPDVPERLTVVMPGTHRLLNPNGEEVDPDDFFWHRLIRDGDVEVLGSEAWPTETTTAPPVVRTEPKPQPAGETGAIA